MGIEGVWWFFKIQESDWTEIKPEFDRAAMGVGSQPEVQPFVLRPVAPPVTPKYAEAVVALVLAGAELGKRLFHRPFQELLFKILIEKPDWESDERLVEFALQSRVLPTVVLMTGIGHERFAQLPGYLGNMLLHPQEVASALEFNLIYTMIVVIGGIKGGAGKSTVAANLAARRVADGGDVLLVDGDEQETTTLWASTRSEHYPEGSQKLTCVQLRGRAARDEVLKLAPRYEDVIIDVGGRW